MIRQPWWFPAISMSLMSKSSRDTIVHCVAVAHEVSTLSWWYGAYETWDRLWYIHARKNVHFKKDILCLKVDEFVENLIWKGRRICRRRQLLLERRYIHLEGKTVLEEMQTHMPDLYKDYVPLRALSEKAKRQRRMLSSGVWAKVIDYGLMEKSKQCSHGTGNIQVGRYRHLGIASKSPRSWWKGNYTRGDTICIDIKDCVVVGDARTVGTIGYQTSLLLCRKGCPHMRQRQGPGSTEIVKNIATRSGE